MCLCAFRDHLFIFSSLVVFDVLLFISFECFFLKNCFVSRMFVFVCVCLFSFVVSKPSLKTTDALCCTIFACTLDYSNSSTSSSSSSLLIVRFLRTAGGVPGRVLRFLRLRRSRSSPSSSSSSSSRRFRACLLDVVVLADELTTPFSVHPVGEG